MDPKYTMVLAPILLLLLRVNLVVFFRTPLASLWVLVGLATTSNIRPRNAHMRRKAASSNRCILAVVTEM